MRRILLTGVGSPASQNFLACLRMAPEKFYIIGADANRYHLEWGELDDRYQSPMTNTPEYLPWLKDLIERERIEFVHGQPDWEVLYLAEHAAEMPAKTFYPNLQTIQLCQDKFAAVNCWAKAGLRERPRIASDGWLNGNWSNYPCWIRATKGAGARGACKLENREQGQAWLDFWRAQKSGMEFMLEEYLPGDEFAFASLWYNGVLICSAARKRVEKCMNLQLGEAGVTSSPVVAVSVHDEKVNRMATEAIFALDEKPHGIFSVDLKCDAEGNPHPTECNAGRFFTTSYFLARAGCNMPYAFVRYGLGLPLPPEVCSMFVPYNAIPAGMLWIRHIDCNQILASETILQLNCLERQALKEKRWDEAFQRLDQILKRKLGMKWA